MKKLIGKSACLPASPVSIIATESNGKLNFAGQGQITTISYEPDIIAISVIKEHKTAANILETGNFSVNLPSAAMLERVFACSRSSGTDSDKSGLFPVFRGESGIPMISDCPLSFCCKLVNQMETGGFYVFFGEIQETFAEEEFADGGRYLTEKSNPLLCNSDGSFYLLGEKVVL